MSFIGKSIFSLSWLGQLFNGSIWSESHDEGVHHLKEHQLETTDFPQDTTIEIAEEAGIILINQEEISEPEEETSEPIEPYTVTRQEVPDDFVQQYEAFLSSRSPSPSFWQRRCQRDDAAGDDCYFSESPLSQSALSDFAESSHFNEESSFEESFEKSSTSNESDCSSSFNDPPKERGNQLIVMSGDDFGWSLSDVADDPRRTGLANFRHNILVRPVPAPSVETLTSVQESRCSEGTKRSAPFSLHKRSTRSYYQRGTEVRSDYETGCGSASSSFDEEGCHRYSRHEDYRSAERFHWERRQPHDFTSDAEEASSQQSRAGKPYRRWATVSQCSDSCLGSDFPSLTSTGSSESEMIGVTGQSSIKGSRRQSNAIHAGTYSNRAQQQQQPKAVVDAAATNALATGASSTTSSQTSLGSASTDCWRGSIHHALAMMEHRGQEMSSLFDQLHEIGDDLASMDDQVGQVTSTLQQCQNRRSPGQRRPFLPSQSVGSYHSLPKPERRGSTASSVGSGRRRHVGSCLDLRSLNEDEMAVIVHRLLTRVCEHTLARQEGKQEVPLIV